MGFKQMIETLKNGTNLLFYLDGNSGLNEKASNLLKINFLDHQIFSRKGVPFLSYLTKSDIVPIVMKRFDDLKTHKIEIGKTIPFLKEKKDCSFSTVLSEIYSLLEKQILLKPDYWECWLYLDKYYMQHKLYKDARINDFYNKYNKSRFEEIELRSNFYLFDRLKSVFHPIHQEFYNSFKEGKLDFDKKQNDIMINHNIIY
jgi:lauroyl/myristoyl acyltransferase